MGVFGDLRRSCSHTNGSSSILAETGRDDTTSVSHNWSYSQSKSEGVRGSHRDEGPRTVSTHN